MTADFDCVDEAGGSGLAACSGTVQSGSAIDTGTLGTKTFRVSARDHQGNLSVVVHHYTVVDRTAPAIVLLTPADGSVFQLGQGVLAFYYCTDGPGSGVAFCAGNVASGETLDTASVGGKTFTVTARDVAGNVATASVAYTVVYAFAGFAPPLATFPALGSEKAGESVPVKFSLAGDQGLAILASGSPTWASIPCDSTGPVVASTPAIGSLSYNRSADRYTFLWSSAKSWVGTCRQLVVTLRDGTVHRANVKFTK